MREECKGKHIYDSRHNTGTGEKKEKRKEKGRVKGVKDRKMKKYAEGIGRKE